MKRMLPFSLSVPLAARRPLPSGGNAGLWRVRIWTFVLALFLAPLCVAALPSVAAAQKITLIRDAEIENTIRAYAAPLFTAANLSPDDVKLYLVKEDTLNAFVAGGQNIFIHTGLIKKTGSPGELIGVLAHETGHIQGGHLARTRDAYEKGQAQAVLAALLGAAAAIGAGRADVGAAIATGGQQTGLRSFLKFSRGQEASADQAGMRLLEATEQSAEGTLIFLERMEGQELVEVTHQDPYMRTHPLTRERIQAIRAHVKESPLTGKPPSSDFQERHARMVAKLKAFTDSPGRTLRTFRDDDASVAARYARAIALYRKADLDQALPLIDGLIAEEPGNPYFHELKGQMLFENGHVKRALPSYRMAVKLLPRNALLHLELARAEIESGDRSLLESAVNNLNAALAGEPDSPFTWRQLAIAHGRLGNKGLSALALAEEAYRRRHVQDATRQAKRAEELLPKGSGAWLRARDILGAITVITGKDEAATQ